MKTSKIIGITGGIGAGKSLLAKIYAEAGFPVFSADQIAKEIVAKGTAGWQEIVDTFGSEILGADGEIQRAILRARISQNPADRQKLDAITHPKIQKRSAELFAEAAHQGHSLLFYEAPLLFEAKSDKKMDAIICVHAPDEIRIQRTMARDGSQREQVEKLLKSQMPQSEKIKRSDFQLLNDGDKSQFRAAALELLERLKEKFLA